jgi:hypothetical protein
MDRGELPSDRSEARCITRMAKSFTLVEDELYKRAASGVLQRCVPIPQGRELLRDIYAGSPAPSYAPLAPVPVAAPCVRALGLGAWAGRTALRSRPPSAGKDKTSESRWHLAEE